MTDDIDLSNRRVLIIEDESLVSMLLEDMLRDMGCEVVGVASRLNEAFDKAASLSYDLAILDVNLHGQQTYPIAEELDRRGRPFVFSTGYGAVALPPQLKDATVLRKPFQQADLERALRAALI